MADVFISYSQKDRTIAKALADFLTSCGYDLWWDYELVGGTKFRTEIKARLETAKAAIVIWTANSVESDWVVEEADEAKHSRKLIATRTADLDIRSVPLGFRSIHTELVTEPERILRALEAIGVAPSRRPEGAQAGPVFIDKRLDADAIAKAEQFAHWEFIKDSKEAASFSGFIEQFPTSSFAALARIQLGKFAAEAWEKLRHSEDVAALRAFVENFRSDPRAAEARTRIDALEARTQEAQSWARIKDTSDLAEVEAHLQAFPDGANARAARARLQALQREREIAERWRAIARSTEPAAYEEFLAAYPDSALAEQARSRLAEVRRAREQRDWDAVRNAPLPAPLLAFLRDHPAGVHAEEALALLATLRRQIEDEAWAVVEAANHPTVWRGFLAAFPHGERAGAAQAKIKQLAASPAPAAPARASPAPAAAAPVRPPAAAAERRPQEAAQARIKRLTAEVTGAERRPGSEAASASRAGDVAPPATTREPAERADEPGGSIQAVAEKLLQTQYVSDAVALIELVGGSVISRKKSGFLFSSDEFVVSIFDATRVFDSEYEMAQWTIEHVVPRATQS